MNGIGITRIQSITAQAITMVASKDPAPSRRFQARNALSTIDDVQHVGLFLSFPFSSPLFPPVHLKATLRCSALSGLQ